MEKIFIKHKYNLDVCFMPLHPIDLSLKPPIEVNGFWVNIASRNPDNHMVIDRIGKVSFLIDDPENWTEYNSTIDARHGSNLN